MSERHELNEPAKIRDERANLANESSFFYFQ